MLGKFNIMIETQTRINPINNDVVKLSPKATDSKLPEIGMINLKTEISLSLPHVAAQFQRVNGIAANAANKINNKIPSVVQ